MILIQGKVLKKDVAKQFPLEIGESQQKKGYANLLLSATDSVQNWLKNEGADGFTLPEFPNVEPSDLAPNTCDSSYITIQQIPKFTMDEFENMNDKKRV